MTSANVSEFTIYKDGAPVGHHRQNWMCHTSWADLLKYEPLEEHFIKEYGYDEEEEYWEEDIVNLQEFLAKRIK